MVCTVNLDDEAASVAAQELRRRARRWRVKALQRKRTSEVQDLLRVGELLDQAADALERAAQPTIERTPALESIGSPLSLLVRDEPLTAPHDLDPTPDEEATTVSDPAVASTLPDIKRRR